MTRRKGMLLLGALILAVGLVLWLRRERSLLDRATRIASVKDWVPLQAGNCGRYATYQWISNGEMLMAHRLDPKRIQFCRRTLNGGMETPLEDLSRRFNAVITVPMTEPALAYSNSVAQLSPDGRWLLWYVSSQKGAQVFCASLDGSRLITWQQNYPMTAALVTWLSDSQHCVIESTIGANTPGTSRVDYIVVYDVNTPAVVKRLPVAPFVEDHKGNYLLLADRLRVLLNLQPDASGSSPQEQIARAGLQQWVVPLQRDSDAVWHDIGLFEQAVLFQDKLLARLEFRGNRQYLRISRPDGSQAHDLGSISYDPKQYWKQMRELRWLPDGKRLSFICAGNLYTIPAD